MPFVVKVGAHQYNVSKGQQIIVDRLETPEGETVELPVLFTFGSDKEEKSLQAVVLRHQKGEKIRVVKYKPKSNYHRQYGFRAFETVLKIS